MTISTGGTNMSNVIDQLRAHLDTIEALASIVEISSISMGHDKATVVVRFDDRLVPERVQWAALLSMLDVVETENKVSTYATSTWRHVSAVYRGITLSLCWSEPIPAVEPIAEVVS